MASGCLSARDGGGTPSAVGAGVVLYSRLLMVPRWDGEVCVGFPYRERAVHCTVVRSLSTVSLACLGMSARTLGTVPPGLRARMEGQQVPLAPCGEARYKGLVRLVLVDRPVGTQPTDASIK